MEAGGDVELMGGGGAKCTADQSEGSSLVQVESWSMLIMNDDNEVCAV